MVEFYFKNFKNKLHYIRIYLFFHFLFKQTTLLSLSNETKVLSTNNSNETQDDSRLPPILSKSWSSNTKLLADRVYNIFENKPPWIDGCIIENVDTNLDKSETQEDTTQIKRRKFKETLDQSTYPEDTKNYRDHHISFSSNDDDIGF